MATVLKRSSELSKLKKKIKRKEKIEKVVEPIKKVLYKLLFVAFSVVFFALTGVICYSVMKVIGERTEFGAACVCFVVLLLGIWIEIRAWKACIYKKKDNGTAAQVKGADGEEKVTEYIEENLPDNCFLLNDINVRCNGKSSQFDHIIIAPQGIFCLETKNYSGSYYQTGSNWSFFCGKQRKYMESPQEQSCYHVSVLSELLFTEKKSMIPLVILANEKAKFNGEDKPCRVIYLKDLKKEISYHEKIYTKKEAEKIARKILSFDVGISKYQEKKN